MNKKQPIFSVLIANYNNGKYLMDAIDSVRQQTYANWEIVLVDDASTDNSDELYAELEKDERIHIYRNEKNMGCGYTKRRCAELANGEICGFLDPDEISSDEPIVFTVKIRRNNPKTKEFQCAVILRDMIEKRFVTFVSPLMPVPEQEIFEARLQLNHHHLAQGKYRVQFDLGLKDYGNVVDNYDGVTDVFLLNVNLLHRDPMVSFAGWDPQYGYMLDNESLEMSLVK